MKLCLDEDMSAKVALALRNRGYDVISSHEVGNDGLTDGEQLSYAAREGRHLVTYNVRDYLELADRWYRLGKRFPKILFLREDRHPRHDIGSQAKALENFLARARDDPNPTDCVEFL